MCDDWYTNGHFCRFDCLLTVFDDWYTVGAVKTAKKDHWCTNRHMSTQESAEYTKPSAAGI